MGEKWLVKLSGTGGVEIELHFDEVKNVIKIDCLKPKSPSKDTLQMSKVIEKKKKRREVC